MQTEYVADRASRFSHTSSAQPAIYEMPRFVHQPGRVVDMTQLLGQFQPISLGQMDAVALLDRNDTKYVIGVNHLYRVLASLREQYYLLDINGIREHPYQTLYFDTADFALYMSHHAGGSNRYKVRSRQYIDTNQSFFEIKHKTDNARTSKKRLQTNDFVIELTPETNVFINNYFPRGAHALEPKLWNSFSRMTLVSKQYQERVTVDIDLQFAHTTRTAMLPHIAIVEVKQDGVQRTSPFIQQMRAAHLHHTGFSKYCIGISLLYDNVKHNNFKPNLRMVQKLMKGHTNA